MAGGGAPAGSFSNGPQGASVYRPTAQPGADLFFQSLAGGLGGALGGSAAGNIGAFFPSTSGTGTFDFSQTPGGQAYSAFQNQLNAYGGLGPGSGAQNEAITAQNQAQAPLWQLGGNIQNAAQGLVNQTGAVFPGAESAAVAGAGGLNQAAGSILNTAFDPQSALFNQLTNQVTNQQNALNAQSGVANTPYGAQLTGQQLQNLDINWQNQQLQRQLQGAAGAGSAYGAAAALPFQPVNSAGSLYSAANTLGNAGAQTTTAAGSLPENTLTNLASQMAQLQGSAVNLGNQQYILPQQLINDAESYLGLGQSASNISGQLGALGLQEQQQSMAGLGSALGTGTNLLFGNSIAGQGGLLGAAGLNPFSSAASSTAGSFLSQGAIDSAVAQGATDFGGGADVASLLPFGLGS